MMPNLGDNRLLSTAICSNEAAIGAGIRIEKSQLGKLFALANQQYEPLFVRNARPRG